eukprot:TRINITY_DN15071_c2_g1_i1.p1 TRINITY_DN15071_c2_g1~~TRINITY_DN15071_c2_g1_i1.p1  ORF type:complete len:672 (+),score=153.79 TRINITY_DN15071_c2_g1_i1:80-2095(+)
MGGCCNSRDQAVQPPQADGGQAGAGPPVAPLGIVAAPAPRPQGAYAARGSGGVQAVGVDADTALQIAIAESMAMQAEQQQAGQGRAAPQRAEQERGRRRPSSPSPDARERHAGGERRDTAEPPPAGWRTDSTGLVRLQSDETHTDALAASGLGCGAGQREECAICFEDLCRAPIGVYVASDGKRSCRHYFHDKCVADLSEECPMCRTAAARVVVLPDPRDDLRGWFDLVDTAADGSLHRNEVEEVFLAQLDLDPDALRGVLDEKWDGLTKGCGSLPYKEVPQLVKWASRALPGRRRAEAPPLALDPGAWFDFWARGQDSLGLERLARALARHCRRQGRPEQDAFAALDGAPMSACSGVTRSAFVASGGVGEYILNKLGEADGAAAAGPAEADPCEPPPPPPAPPADWPLGCRVRRHPGRWRHGDEDGGNGMLGTVRAGTDDPGSVVVVWDLAQGPPCTIPTSELHHCGYRDTTRGVEQVAAATGLPPHLAFRVLMSYGSPEEAVQWYLDGGEEVQVAIVSQEGDMPPGCLVRVTTDVRFLRNLVDSSQSLVWTGQREQYAGQIGYVLDFDPRDAAARVEHFDGVAIWYPIGAIHRARDPVYDFAAMRFRERDRVDVRMPDGSWAAGRVANLWYRERGWCARPSAAYRVALDRGGHRLVYTDDADSITVHVG